MEDSKPKTDTVQPQPTPQPQPLPRPGERVLVQGSCGHNFYIATVDADGLWREMSGLPLLPPTRRYPFGVVAAGMAFVDHFHKGMLENLSPALMKSIGDPNEFGETQVDQAFLDYHRAVLKAASK